MFLNIFYSIVALMCSILLYLADAAKGIWCSFSLFDNLKSFLNDKLIKEKQNVLKVCVLYVQ